MSNHIEWRWVMSQNDNIIWHLVDNNNVVVAGYCWGVEPSNRDLIESAPELLKALEEANKNTMLYDGHPGRYASVIAKAKGQQ